MKVKFQMILIIATLLLSNKAVSGVGNSWTFIDDTGIEYIESYGIGVDKNALTELDTTRPFSNFFFVYENTTINHIEGGIIIDNASVVLNITTGNDGVIHVEENGLVERGHNRTISVDFDLNVVYRKKNISTDIFYTDYITSQFSNVNKSIYEYGHQEDIGNTGGQPDSFNRFYLYSLGNEESDEYDRFGFIEDVDIVENSTHKTVSNVRTIFTHRVKNDQNDIQHQVSLEGNYIELQIGDEKIQINITDDTSELQVPFKEIATDSDGFPTSILQVSNLIYNFNYIDGSLPSNSENYDYEKPSFKLDEIDNNKDNDFDLEFTLQSNKILLIIVVIMFILIIVVTVGLTIKYLTKNYTFKQD